MKKTLLCLLAVSLSVLTAAGQQIFNVKDFGAKGDGVTVDTPAIDAAIAAASAAKGGAVEFPQGTYLSYSIHLQSNVTLRLAAGSVIKAAPVTQTQGYDTPEPNDSNYQDFGHSHWHNSLLWGEGLENVTIEGEGLIDGTDVLSRGEPRRGWNGPSEANKGLALKECKGVTLKGVKFLSCGHFALLLTGVDDLLIDGVDADTNRDAFDIDCCERVVIRNCRVNTMNDDAIVLKCSYALGYAKPTQDVLIEDCSVSGYDVGSMLAGTCTTQQQYAPDRDGPTGRIKLGTESNGGFRRITVKNCTFTHCRGLALETVDGAEMCDISVSDLTMSDICTSPIYIRLGDRMRGPSDLPPSSIHGVTIKNVSVKDADSRYACQIVGIEGHPVKDVRIENLDIEFRGGITLDDVKEQRGSNPFFFGRNSGYPEPSAHGIQPAWGFSISHADGVLLKNIRLTLLQPDERELFFKEDVSNLKVKKLKTFKNF